MMREEFRKIIWIAIFICACCFATSVVRQDTAKEDIKLNHDFFLKLDRKTDKTEDQEIKMEELYNRISLLNNEIRKKREFRFNVFYVAVGFATILFLTCVNFKSFKISLFNAYSSFKSYHLNRTTNIFVSEIDGAYKIIIKKWFMKRYFNEHKPFQTREEAVIFAQDLKEDRQERESMTTKHKI